MIGSNIFITNKFSFGNLITKLIKEFKARVLADGGTFEAESCLKTTLESLNLQYPPLLITAPVVSGNNYSGQTLTTTNGVFDGITPLVYTYQWYLDGSPILGANSSTYVVTGNGTISCKVTATNSFGSVTSTSNEIIPDNRLIFSVKTDNAGTSATNQFTIPTTGAGYLYDIETSDGQLITGRTGSTTITFPSAGTYDIYISGNFPRFLFNSTGDRLKIINLKNFGIYGQGSTTQTSAFSGCNNLIITANDSGYFGNVTSFATCFRDCWSITSIPKIDFSKATDMFATFIRCYSLIDFKANVFDSTPSTLYGACFVDTNLSQTSIDNILVSLDANGVLNGTFNQSGGGNLPSSVGLTAKANLVSKGWTITTN